MSGSHAPKEMGRQVVGGVVAVLAVTAASVLWRLPQARQPQAVLAVYWVSAILMLTVGLIVFRQIVRRGYEQELRLTPFPFFLQLLIWGMFFAYPCIYNPYNWAWSSPSHDQVPSVQLVTGWGSVGIGLVILIISMAWLGLSRSTGSPSELLT